MPLILILINFGISLYFISWAYPDEAMYIINAAQMAGFDSSYNNSYGIGFSLLITPFLFFSQKMNPHTIALILNSIFLLWMVGLLNKIQKSDSKNIINTKKLGLWILLIVVSYPALILYSKHAIPEVLLAFGVIGQYYLIDRYQKDNRFYLIIFA